MSRNRLLGVAVAFSLAATTGLVALTPAAGAGTTRTFIVLYKQPAVSSDAASKIEAAGGSLVASYPQIGVVVARSSNDAFAATVKKDTRVQGVSSTDGFGVRLPDSLDQGAEAAAVDPATTSTWGDNLSGLQWDMVQIHVPEAQAVNAGSSSVVVGDIDTGLDFTHPDLAPNVDFTNSASCIGGVPNTSPSAWADDNGHGTHTAGTIAAAKNTIGIVGVAPNVKIAAIKAGDAAGFFFPEAVVCAFMWAGTHHIQVTNNSYFADPWLFNCKNDPGQRAIWLAEQRAIQFAESRGVVVVAASGNENLDLSKTNVDTISPDFPPGSETTRTVTNACAVVPVEVPGVIGVSADGNLMQKSFYSSYGVGDVSVVAPGGDSIFQLTADAPNGRVLSTFPASLIGNLLPSRRVFDCSVSPCAAYGYLQGTSMASPHAAGVIALIESQLGPMPAGPASAMLDSTADPVPCPEVNPVDYPINPLIGLPEFALCTGGPGYNGFYGHGQVDAFNAVTHSSA